MATKRKRSRRPSQVPILSAIAHYPRVRHCDSCGITQLTINQGASASSTMKNGRIVCADCRNLILPILPYRLQLDCEVNYCDLKSQELHGCSECGVHLLCTRHHWFLHYLEDGQGTHGDFEFRWAACISGIDLCGLCSSPAEVACECPSGYTDLYCSGHHRESCSYSMPLIAREAPPGMGTERKSFTGEVWQTGQVIDGINGR